ncbi:hypothetical protein [Methylobacterium sp. PvR107]|uniref:hypothetical protein n=1 Tax=Methylobacterium sp. PvR107 TaxID=2806597 RepID=UPI001AE18749|nr:hypothetical protein [Methylobacterium sp. PvR107]MBP1180979.1 hypothetical protein [Methylobacterium sp. PvR107]
MSSRSLSPTPGNTPDAVAEAQFRARMARVGPDRGGRRAPRSSAPGRGRGVRLGWKSWLVVVGLIVLPVVAGVVAWPPVQDCRQQDRTTRFYAGDSFDRCIRRGIAARIDTADQRIKSLMRGSGH